MRRSFRDFSPAGSNETRHYEPCSPLVKRVHHDPKFVQQPALQDGSRICEFRLSRCRWSQTHPIHGGQDTTLLNIIPENLSVLHHELHVF